MQTNHETFEPGKGRLFTPELMVKFEDRGEPVLLYKTQKEKKKIDERHVGSGKSYGDRQFYFAFPPDTPIGISVGLKYVCANLERLFEIQPEVGDIARFVSGKKKYMGFPESYFFLFNGRAWVLIAPILSIDGDEYKINQPKQS